MAKRAVLRRQPLEALIGARVLHLIAAIVRQTAFEDPSGSPWWCWRS